MSKLSTYLSLCSCTNFMACNANYSVSCVNVILRRYGVCTGEIKSVSHNPSTKVVNERISWMSRHAWKWWYEWSQFVFLLRYDSAVDLHCELDQLSLESFPDFANLHNLYMQVIKMKNVSVLDLHWCVYRMPCESDSIVTIYICSSLHNHSQNNQYVLEMQTYISDSRDLKTPPPHKKPIALIV